MTVGVVGAGAMGAGIAQVAAAAGHRVVLADAAPRATSRAYTNIAKAVARDVEKGRSTRDAADALLARIGVIDAPLGDGLASFAPCSLVIEAIVEDLTAKQSLFRGLES